VTYELSDAAVWNDGTPISAADFECRWMAALNTPESIFTAGYDQIVAISEGDAPNVVQVDFAVPYAPYRTLFSYPGLLQASQHDDCNDVSADFPAPYPYSFGPYTMIEWTAEQIVYEANPDYAGSHTPLTDRIVFVPAPDGTTLLRSGAVDFIYVQSYTGLDQELAADDIAYDAEPGSQFEGLYFQQDPACEPTDGRSCAFTDAAYREAFSKSVDLDALYAQIYEPFAQGIPLLTCGPVPPGPYCEDVFVDTYDPAGAEVVMADAGWSKNDDGFWVDPDTGEVPQVHWMADTGNTRRESAQDYLIPLLADAGFDVVADNCEAVPCVFQDRLYVLDYDLFLAINFVAPDPAYLVTSYTCAQIPSEENQFFGYNTVGWCNEEASALLADSDTELDEAARADDIKAAIELMAADHVMLPTLQFPNVGAYGSERVSGTQNNLANFDAFLDWWNFEDLDGDGQVVIGAEQFPPPDCSNPLTLCGASAWFGFTTSNHTFPNVYNPTNDQTFEPNEILVGEAVAESL
jgi:peptide/nickel transport system substrate-binding protein